MGACAANVAWPLIVMPVLLMTVIVVYVASRQLGARTLFLALATLGGLTCLALGIVWVDGPEKVAGAFLLLGASGLFLGIAALSRRRPPPPPE